MSKLSEREIELRDRFALQALRLFSINDAEVEKLIKGDEHPLHGAVAKFCYDIADSTLKERAKKLALDSNREKSNVKQQT